MPIKQVASVLLLLQMLLVEIIDQIVNLLRMLCLHLRLTVVAEVTPSEVGALQGLHARKLLVPDLHEVAVLHWLLPERQRTGLLLVLIVNVGLGEPSLQVNLGCVGDCLTVIPGVVLKKETRLQYPRTARLGSATRSLMRLIVADPGLQLL